MKILFGTGIYPPDAGGPATYTRAFARAALRAGHGVEVLCYGDQNGYEDQDGFPVQRIGRDQPMVMRYWHFASSLHAMSDGADGIYLQGPVSEGFPGMLGELWAGKPTVMKVVGDYAWEMYRQQSADSQESLDEFLRHRHGGKIRLLEWIERWAARRAKRVIVPSKYLAEVVHAWGVPDERVRVIYNAAEALPEGRGREEVRQAFSVNDRRVMLTAVRCVPWKGVDLIIDLMSDLPADIVFVIAGDGPAKAEWEALAASKGLTDRVRFVGRLDRAQLADWYRASDLFVLPSGYEGFPHVVPEAASVGLPSLVSDRGGNPETKELLGDALVQVLPYRDARAWRDALSGRWPERTAPSVPEALRFETMFAKTMEVLNNVARPISEKV